MRCWRSSLSIYRLDIPPCSPSKRTTWAIQLLENVSLYLGVSYAKDQQRRSVTDQQWLQPNHCQQLQNLSRTIWFSWSKTRVSKRVFDSYIHAKTNELDGMYHLDAAAVCLPGFWRLHEKYRTTIDELHFDARVPHYAEKLQLSMNRFFDKMTPARAVVRNNVCCPNVSFKIALKS